MVVEILAVGTELLLGNIVNSNARYLSEQCASLGLSMYHQSVVGDNMERAMESFQTAWERSDIVIVTGGLGPTEDDMTKEACANVLGLGLIEDSHTRVYIEEYFKRSGHLQEIPENNWKQAVVVEGAKVLDNPNGLAPGQIIEKNGKTAILLPGPPNELLPLFEQKVAPFLNSLRPETIVSRMIKICGVGESKAETMILDLINGQKNPTIAPYAKTGEVHFRITAQAESEEEGLTLMEPVVKELKNRFGESVYTTDEKETLEMVVVKLLKEHNLTLTSAESCTGGLFAGRIINVAGVSDFYKEGFITYSNETKRKRLDVNEETLKSYGAVSEQTAREMAVGGAAAAKADSCIAITGVAGPDGGTEEKPVGLVYIACFLNGKVEVEEFYFRGNREKVREQSVIKAVDLLRRSILKNYKK